MIRARLAQETVAERIVIDVETEHDTPSQIWWETTSGAPPAVPDRLDAAALALVPKAMNFGQDLHLDGPVSWRLLANLEEYIDAWTIWQPETFRQIAVTADEVIDDRGIGAGPLADRAVSALSGGVDGVYAAYANQHGLLGRRSLQVAAAVLIQGFDLAVDDHEGFGIAAQGARAIAEEIGIPLVTMRTNWQSVACPDWQMSFGIAMAAVLHLFADRAGNIIQAADTTYGHLDIPWGSNPITSPLLASGRLRVAQPGAGVTRTQKVEAIGGLASVREHLRVCWEGDHRGRNCGRCEKCVRTKVNFLAAGHGTIPALGPLAPRELRGLSIRSSGAYAVFAEMAGETERLDPDVADDVRWLLAQPVVPAGAPDDDLS